MILNGIHSNKMKTYNIKGKYTMLSGVRNFGGLGEFDRAERRHKFRLQSRYILKGQRYWSCKTLETYEAMEIKLWEN